MFAPLRTSVPVRVASVVAAALLGASAILAPSAAAQDVPDPGWNPDWPPHVQVDPVWSGLDTRDWSGPIPDPGLSAATVPLDESISLAGAGEAYRQAYGTIDQHGERAIASSAVLLPHGTPPPGGWPVIAWAHGTTGLGNGCTPSTLPRSDRDAEYLDHWLEQGYAIVAADYVGLGTPGLMSYLNGHTTAQGVVDSVAAAHDADLPLSPRWALVGQSQGGGAALNTAARVSQFPSGADLDYRGVVATGPPANIELIFQLAGPGFPPFVLPTGLNTYALYILAGFREAHPELDIDGLLTTMGRELVDEAEELCYFPLADRAEGIALGDLFSAPLQSVPGIYERLREYMGTPVTGYDRPVFIGQGLLDLDVPAPAALSLAAEMAAHGNPAELHVYPDQDHNGTVYAATGDATAFLDRVMG